MNSSAESMKQSRGDWIGTLALIAAHILAFAMLYFHTFLYPTMEELFSQLRFPATPEFIRNVLVADFIRSYGIVFLAIVALDLIVLNRLSRSRSKWLSGYSHSVLLLIAFAALVSIGGMISPIDLSRPLPNAPPIATTNGDEAASNEVALAAKP